MPANIASFDCSPNKSHLICALNNIIRIFYNPRSLSEHSDLKGHRDPVSKVRYSMDGQYIASGINVYTQGHQISQQEIKIWHANTCKQISPKLPGDYQNIIEMEFSQNSLNIIVATCESLRIIDWRNGIQIKALQIYKLRDFYCVISDKHRIFQDFLEQFEHKKYFFDPSSLSKNEMLWVSRIKTTFNIYLEIRKRTPLNQMRSIILHNYQWGSTAQISPNSKIIAAVSANQSLYFCEFPSRKQFRTRKINIDCSFSIAFLSDNKLIYTSDRNLNIIKFI